MATTRSASSSPRYGRQGNDGRPPGRPPSQETAQAAHPTQDAPSNASLTHQADHPSPLLLKLKLPQAHSNSSPVAASSIAPTLLSSASTNATAAPAIPSTNAIATPFISAPDGGCAAPAPNGFSAGISDFAAALNQLQDPPIASPCAAPSLQPAATTTTPISPTMAAPIPPLFYTTPAAAEDGLLHHGSVLGGNLSGRPGTHFGSFIPPVAGSNVEERRECVSQMFHKQTRSDICE